MTDAVVQLGVLTSQLLNYRLVSPSLLFKRLVSSLHVLDPVLELLIFDSQLRHFIRGRFFVWNFWIKLFLWLNNTAASLVQSLTETLSDLK